jgi:hypothetical protein
MPHIVGGNEPILQNYSSCGWRESGDLHISCSLNWNFTGIGDARMLVHLRSVGHPNVQLIAGTDQEAF